MNPFAVLGIEEMADDDTVRAAYLAAVRRSPPDRDPEGFRRIREAYEAVRDEERRLALRPTRVGGREGIGAWDLGGGCWPGESEGGEGPFERAIRRRSLRR